MCHNPLSCEETIQYNRIELISLSSFTSNLIRNISLHFGSPFKEINTAIINLVNSLHQPLHLDPSDLRTTYGGTSYHIGGYTFHEDVAGNFLHLLLIFLCVILCFVSTRLKNNQKTKNYFITVGLGFVILNLLLKWNPWGSRIQLPLFILSCPVIGHLLSVTVAKRMTNTILIILILSSTLWIFHNHTRPLLWRKHTLLNTSRKEQYFLSTPGYQSSFNKAAQYLQSKNCSKVGTILEEFFWEYPLWVLTKNVSQLEIRAMDVQNPSSIYESKNFKPCAIIENRLGDATEILVNGQKYIRANQFRILNVFTKGVSYSSVFP